MITLDRIRLKRQIVRGVIYARFSSEMQRDESIDAQVRAIGEYAKRNDIVIIEQYIDKAKSATTDNRPEFQRMVTDAAKNQFDVVIVHKLDRFARNRNDSIAYRMQLKRHGVVLISALEYIDEGSPESIILESVLEAMAEYYSRNLAREVEKGKRENALKAKHVGGPPPLGYDVDPATKKLVLNHREAECVKHIFKRYLEGAGYTVISDELNCLGYKSKLGTRFAHNSLHSVIRNPKYTGVYTYNRSVAKDVDGKRNGHRYKDESEIIRLEGAIPQIISKEDFDLAQEMLVRRAHKVACYSAKQTYLLSGKIICGECGSAYTGNSRRGRVNTIPLYVSYRCCRFNKKANCKNREVRREVLESIVFDNLAQKVFDTDLIPKLSTAYHKYLRSRHKNKMAELDTCKRELKEIDKEIANLIRFIAKSASEAVAEQLANIEARKAEVTFTINRLNAEMDSNQVSEEELTRAFNYARELFISGQLISTRKLVERFIHEVVVFNDRVEIFYNFGFSLEPIKYTVDTEALARMIPKRPSAEHLLKKDLARTARASSSQAVRAKNNTSQRLDSSRSQPAADQHISHKHFKTNENPAFLDAKTPQYDQFDPNDTTVFSLAQSECCAYYGGEREIRTLGWG